MYTVDKITKMNSQSLVEIHLAWSNQGSQRPSQSRPSCVSTERLKSHASVNEKAKAFYLRYRLGFLVKLWTT